nr:MAG TPA: hypothetical protein [Caudoviricetes sp.]
MKRISLTIVFTNYTFCRTNSCRFRDVSGRSSLPLSTSGSRRRRKSGRSLNENDERRFSLWLPSKRRSRSMTA